MSLRPISLLRWFLLILCGLFLFSFAENAKGVQAADSPITIIAQGDIVHFPTSIDFTLTANDSVNPITTATIYITYKDVPYGNAAGYAVPISQPAQRITLDYRADTSSLSNFHSPGTPVEYYWVLQDSASRQYVDLPQDFTTVDTRYSWQHLTQGLLQVNWYNRPADFGQVLLSKANDSITHISSVLGRGLQRPINLWVYADNSDFHGALAPNSYEWVGGEAHPFLNEAFISVVDTSDDTLIRDMPHELTHLVFHQLITQGPVPPTWFDEGLAVYNQLYHEPDMRARFEQAVNAKSLLRLFRITAGFPSDADQAYLAYAQSWDLISYMYKTFGQAKMTRLIQNMNNEQTDFDQQLTQAIGVDSLHLENQWLLSLGQASVLSPDQLTPTSQPIRQTTSPASVADTTAPILITSGVLLILLPLLGIVAIFVYASRKRRRAAVVSPAFPGSPAVVPPYAPYAPITGSSLPPTPLPGGQYYAPNPPQYQPLPQDGYRQPYYPPPELRNQSGTPPQTYMPFSYPVEQASGSPSETFGSFQEGIPQQPRKSAPQD